MTNDSICTTGFQPDATAEKHLFDTWFDPIEHVRDRVRTFIGELIEGELSAVLARPRYGRRAQDGGAAANSGSVAGHRHGSRMRMLTGTFGRTEMNVTRARLQMPDGKATEWKSEALRSYQRRTPISPASTRAASAGAGRAVRRAKTLSTGPWRKVKGDWVAWNAARRFFPFIERDFADSAYAGEQVATATRIAVEIVNKLADQVGFVIMPRRWVVERFFACINRNRRRAKDFEATIASATAFLYTASVMLLIRRLARQS